MNRIILGKALSEIAKIPNESVNLIYIDPPFNTGKVQEIHGKSFSDSFSNFIEFLEPHIREAKRVLKDNGSFYLHLDYREIHYAKVLCDQIFGRNCFVNEIIWAYDYGARTKKRWPTKHDNILLYSKTPGKYVFNYDDIDKIPYMAPGLQKDPAKAATGKVPTDVWWHTIVPTSGHERVNYPTQKPLGILRRIILASSNKSDVVLDFFAGSGTTGFAAQELGRQFILIDSSREAFDTMKQRFSGVPNVNFEEPNNESQ